LELDACGRPVIGRTLATGPGQGGEGQKYCHGEPEEDRFHTIKNFLSMRTLII
jgi:hypothetical protein